MVVELGVSIGLPDPAWSKTHKTHLLFKHDLIQPLKILCLYFKVRFDSKRAIKILDFFLKNKLKLNTLILKSKINLILT